MSGGVDPAGRNGLLPPGPSSNNSEQDVEKKIVFVQKYAIFAKKPQENGL